MISEHLRTLGKVTAGTSDGTMQPTTSPDTSAYRRDTSAYRRAEFDHIIVPASEEPHYRTKVTNGLGAETKWLTIDADEAHAIGRVLTDPPSMWAISSRVETTTDDGYTSVREVPTFYLHPNVQGTLTEAAAERVAAGMLAGLVDNPDAIFHVTAVRVTP